MKSGFSERRLGREYALYQGDEFVCIATMKELAERLRVRPETIEYYASDANLRRAGDARRRICVRVA